MQVDATSLTNFTPQINEYNLEGGVIIRDKTNGIGKAIFSSEFTKKYEKSAYEVFINGKKLIFPTCSSPSSSINLIFVESIKITFKQKGEFIKITEKDANSKTVFYIDLKKSIEGIAYDAYPYIPKEINEENAMQKVESLEIDFPDFKGDIAVYNRHGVAVFGWDNNDKKYALCWANPHQEKVKKIECSFCERYRDGGTSVAKSADGSVNFRYIFGKGHYLNAETAVKISLTK